MTSTAQVYAGPGLGIAEVQVTVEPAQVAGKGKLITVGIPRAEVQQIVTTVLKISAFTEKPDYSLNCRLIGAEKWHSHFGLALCIAIIGSYFHRPIPSNCIFVGEIDLRKRIRGGSVRLVENLRRSIQSGDLEPSLMVVVPSALNISSIAGAEVIVCETLADVAKGTWGRVT